MALFGFGKKKVAVVVVITAIIRQWRRQKLIKLRAVESKYWAQVVQNAMNWQRTQKRLWQNWEWIQQLTM